MCAFVYLSWKQPFHACVINYWIASHHSALDDLPQ